MLSISLTHYLYPLLMYTTSAGSTLLHKTQAMWHMKHQWPDKATCLQSPVIAKPWFTCMAQGLHITATAWELCTCMNSTNTRYILWQCPLILMSFFGRSVWYWHYCMLGMTVCPLWSTNTPTISQGMTAWSTVSLSLCAWMTRPNSIETICTARQQSTAQLHKHIWTSGDPPLGNEEWWQQW